MTATFMKRTVSNARRTISKARSRELPFMPVQQMRICLFEIVDKITNKQRVGRVVRRRNANPRLGYEILAIVFERLAIDHELRMHEAITGIVQIAAADRLVLVEPRGRRRNDRE